MTETRTETIRPRSRDREVWLRRGCALVVAGVAAYGSYEHQRGFALHGGADPVSAAMWPLSVDGLLLLATVGLLKSGPQASLRVRLAVWLSFLLGIAVSLAANIAAAPTLAWQPVLIAGWPPVALLLAAELLTHHPRPREQTETELAVANQEPDRETDNETGKQTKHAVTTKEVVSKPTKPSAEQVMWEHFLREQARGRMPTGAELDRVAGTNNYGRTVLRRWREQGRIPPADPDRSNGHRLVPRSCQVGQSRIESRNGGDGDDASLWWVWPTAGGATGTRTASPLPRTGLPATRPPRSTRCRPGPC